jgi:Ran GTPase-activating protein (RanGAP) involved in mRNA processing and transport
LAENQTIEEFHLAWNRLRSKACAIFIKQITMNSRLTLLDLSWNGAALHTAKALMDFLKKNATLEKLHLDHNQFNTECATYIGKGLARNETLKHLTCHNNPLESSGCYAIIRPLIKHPLSALQIVDFHGIAVNRDFIDLLVELSSILPQLTIKLVREREKETNK